METGKHTSADRNRKQTGKSEEIVADSAICTCDKGSKPGTFRVTSQQKIYCNGARKLVATDQDKDIKSLNFGSCAAKNNGPCSPNIVWSNTYNKIAIKGKMYPLTVKSSGTCKAGGGRINIQTSGQQVVVKPSASPRKANSTAHKSPIFTEEDWKYLPQEDEKSQNKRVPAAVQVNNVLVNGKREITITPYDQEELLFTTSLTAGSMRGTGVKWDVCYGNRVIAKGLTEAPARTYFTKEGTYSVYAYVHKPGSPKGKGVVRITVSYPKFKSIEWKDDNGKPVTYIGLRNKVFAHVSLPGCKGISVNCRFYYNGYEGKTYLSALTPITLSAAGKVKITLSLSSDQLKKIIEDRKRFSNGQKIRIYLELSSRHWIENITKASQHPILFNDKIEFRSLVIYKDSDCKQKLQGGIADSGSTVYVRVSTVNMETGKIRLDVYKHETGNQEEKSPKPSPVYSTSFPVNSTGVYKFSLTLAAPPYKEGTAYKVVVSWIFSSQSSNGNVNNNTDRQTSKEPKQYILKGKEILFSVKRHIPMPKAEPSKANVNRTEPEKGGCPRCREEWTDMLPRLKQVFGKVSPNRLKAVAQAYTEHMKALSMDTCWVKAHFFAQATIETGYTLNISEKMNYKRERFEDIFPSKIFKGRWTKDGKWVSDRDKNGKRIYKDGMKRTLDKVYSITDTQERKIVLANIAYANKNGNGDYYSGDGWRFRGSGLVQITGRENYSKIQHLINTRFKLNVDIMTNGADTINGDDRIATLASMCYVYICTKQNPQEFSNNKKDCTAFSKMIGNEITEWKDGKVVTTNWRKKQKSFDRETSKAFLTESCLWNKKSSPKPKENPSRWHEPVDNPQITIWTQSGRNEPSNAVFGAKRPNGHYHQGVDLFCTEGSNVYACLDGIVESITDSPKGQGQTIVLKITDKEQINYFRQRRRDYNPTYDGEKKQGEGFDENSNHIYLVYYHLSYILVKKGSVYAGQVIGYSGISGIIDGTCGPHLHFEIRSERRCRDLTKRCNPAYYVYYKVKMSPEEKRKQEERMKKGQLKDFYGRK
ncbi:peptidoglycan DD-metalloendopeptidase family protein [Prevotella melaninogenica]